MRELARCVRLFQAGAADTLSSNPLRQNVCVKTEFALKSAIRSCNNPQEVILCCSFCKHLQDFPVVESELRFIKKVYPELKLK